MRNPDSDASRAAALGATLALHALALGALLAYEPAREALRSAVIMIDFLAPPRAEQKFEIPTELPRQKPFARRALRNPDPAPILTQPAELLAAPAAQVPMLVSPVTPPPMIAATVPESVAQTVTLPVFSADYLENPPPPYPELSRRLGEQGRVVLRVLVNGTGRTDEVQVRTSSGHARLDNVARETVRRWKFVPAQRGPEPIAAWVLIPISFRLEG